MKTLMLYIEDEHRPVFYELDGDYTRWNNCYVNGGDTSKERVQELVDYREREDIKVSTPKDVYDTWLIEQNLGLDFGIWDDYKELFTMGDTP